MYEKTMFWVGFPWVGGCLKGPGWSLWVVLATSLLVGRHPAGIWVVSGGDWVAAQLGGWQAGRHQAGRHQADAT